MTDTVVDETATLTAQIHANSEGKVAGHAVVDHAVGSCVLSTAEMETHDIFALCLLAATAESAVNGAFPLVLRAWVHSVSKHGDVMVME